MRYHNFALNANAEHIKENTTINLREYAYENTLADVNNYMFKNMKNDITFFAYREEGNSTLAVLSYDEKKIVLNDAFAYIAEMLSRGDTKS